MDWTGPWTGLVQVDVVRAQEVTPHRGHAGSTVTTQLAHPAPRRRGLGDVLVLEVRVHRYLPLEPFLTCRTHERQRLFSSFLFLNLDGHDVLLVGSSIVSSLLSELLQ